MKTEVIEEETEDSVANLLDDHEAAGRVDTPSYTLLDWTVVFCYTLQSAGLPKLKDFSEYHSSVYAVAVIATVDVV